MFRGLIAPIGSFPTLAEDLRGIESRNANVLERIVGSGGNTNLFYPCDHYSPSLPPPSSPPLAVQGPSMAENQANYFVACGDADPELAFPEGSDSDEEFESYYSMLERKSKFGAQIFAAHRLRCLTWEPNH